MPVMGTILSIIAHWVVSCMNVEFLADDRMVLFRLFFCAKPKNSVPDFQKLSSPKFRKTQFLAKNSVSNHSKTEFFRKISPKITKKCQKNSKFAKTQFQKSKNSVPKSQKLSFPEIHDSQMA